MRGRTRCEGWRSRTAEPSDKGWCYPESDAEGEARNRVGDLWRQLDGEAAEKVNAAQAPCRR